MPNDERLVRDLATKYSGYIARDAAPLPEDLYFVNDFLETLKSIDPDLHKELSKQHAALERFAREITVSQSKEVDSMRRNLKDLQASLFQKIFFILIAGGTIGGAIGFKFIENEVAGTYATIMAALLTAFALYTAIMHRQTEKGKQREIAGQERVIQIPNEKLLLEFNREWKTAWSTLPAESRLDFKLAQASKEGIQKK